MKYLICFVVFTSSVLGQTIITQTQTVNGATQTQTVSINNATGDTTSVFVGGARTYDCGQIAAGIDSVFTITVQGAVIGKACMWGANTLPEQGLDVSAWCDTVNQIKVVLSNRTNNFLNPASRTYTVTQKKL